MHDSGGDRTSARQRDRRGDLTMAVEMPRVLIATLSVSARTGTDTYTRDLALALLHRGYLPIVYATYMGRTAEELRRATIPVVSNITDVNARPDVIHGHHALETLAALARFPDVPALFVCHDALTWHSVPPKCRQIRRWVAVDRNCRDRMMFEHGIPEDRIRVFANAVDLARFRRRPPLPARPRRALLFSNAAAENTFAAPIRKACEERGISLDLMGEQSGQPSWHPEAVLPEYDLVFGKARCALEAAAVGAAVIVCDARGLGAMMTTASVDAMRALNFGARTLQRPITSETIGSEIDRYDAADASAVCDMIRASAGIDVLVDQYASLYAEIGSEPLDLTAEESLNDLAGALSVVSQSLRVAQTYPQGGLRRAILNSRALSIPVAAAYRFKRRFRL